MGSSKTPADAVNPFAARVAATTPFSAARPAFSALAMVPRLARNPELNPPAMPSAQPVCSRSSRRR